MNGNFVISLDFELHWGVFDKTVLDKKGREKFIRTREEVIPRLLDLFTMHDIKVTWATVGFLFARDIEQLESFFPAVRPSYLDKTLDPYLLFNDKFPGNTESENPFHFAHSIIHEILGHEGQEIASHSFSHFYCLEPDVSVSAFESDLESAQSIARQNFGIDLKSFVFPRNQFNDQFIQVIKSQGFEVIRSNPNQWFWDIDGSGNLRLKRLLRLLDTYLLLRRNFDPITIDTLGVYHNVGTRFFRPYSERMKGLESLKVARIKREMKSYAASGNTYHLWWHPHNFSDNLDQNLSQLSEILIYYKHLNSKYDMISANMGDLSKINNREV